jgi:hypothetical protein
MTVLLLWPVVCVAQHSVSISNFSVRAGTMTFTVTWADSSLIKESAPDTVACVPPALQTLQASAASYCERSGVKLALDNTEPDAVYQLYKDGEPLSGATVTTASGGAATFTGTFHKGTYTVQTVANAFCPAAMADTHVVAAIAAPTVPVIFSNDGPKCVGTPITFTGTVPDGATGLDWKGAVSGEGATLTSGTAAGVYSARVRSFLTVGDITCYSAFAPDGGSTITACFDFVSVLTWSDIALTWSDFVSSRGCEGGDFPGAAGVPLCRRHILTDTLYFYNAPFVEQYAALMCPSPWSLPSAYAVHSAAASGQLPVVKVREHLSPEGAFMDQGCVHVAAGEPVMLRPDGVRLQADGQAGRDFGCRVLCVR